MTVFALLGLMIIALSVLGGALFGRRNPIAGAAIGVALATGFVLSYMVQPLFGYKAASDELRRVKSVLAGTETDLAESRRKEADARDRLASEAAQTVDAKRQHASFRDKVSRAVTGVHAAYGEPTHVLFVDGATRLNRALSPDDHIVAEIEDLQHLKVRPTSASMPSIATASIAPPPDARVELDQLKHRLAKPLRTPNYDVEPYPSPDLIAGRSGKYYAIDLKDADKGVRFFFDGGKYTLKTGTREFRTALNQFIGDVLGKMDGRVTYDLFVRGSADNKPFVGRIDQDYAITDVRYLRQLGDDRYSTETQSMRIINGVVRNQDLPNLRAAFIRELVASTYPVKPPFILEGTVTPKRDDRDRNVELILFVQW